MVTDQELAFRNAIHDYFPNISLLRCWNHVFKNVGDWLDKQHSKQDEKQFYIKEVRGLINCDSKIDYDRLKLEKQKNWADPFIQYFNTYISRDIDQIAKWTLVSLNIYNPYSGITTNTSEGMNNLFKIMVNRKDVPAELAILSLSYLTNYYYNEIKRGFCDEGKFYQTLK